MKTALGKDETLSTVQLDFLLPERFDLTYVGEDGKPHRPVVIHRGVVSTMERFVAFLIEEYKGAFLLGLLRSRFRSFQFLQVSITIMRNKFKNSFKMKGSVSNWMAVMKKSVIKSVKHKCKKYHICWLLGIKRSKIRLLMSANMASKTQKQSHSQSF